MPWTPPWPSTLEGKRQQTSGLQAEITRLTISHTSIDPLFHVDNVWNYNNEGDYSPDHKKHEHRDISWYVPTEHKNAKCVHRNSLYVCSIRKTTNRERICAPRTCNRSHHCEEHGTRKTCTMKNVRQCHSVSTNLLYYRLHRTKGSFRGDLWIQV